MQRTILPCSIMLVCDQASSEPRQCLTPRSEFRLESSSGAETFFSRSQSVKLTLQLLARFFAVRFPNFPES